MSDLRNDPNWHLSGRHVKPTKPMMPPNEIILNSFEQEKGWAIRPHLDENGVQFAILYQALSIDTADPTKKSNEGAYMAHLPDDISELRGLAAVIDEFVENW